MNSTQTILIIDIISYIQDLYDQSSLGSLPLSSKSSNQLESSLLYLISSANRAGIYNKNLIFTIDTQIRDSESVSEYIIKQERRLLSLKNVEPFGLHLIIGEYLLKNKFQVEYFHSKDYYSLLIDFYYYVQSKKPDFHVKLLSKTRNGFRKLMKVIGLTVYSFKYDKFRRMVIEKNIESKEGYGIIYINDNVNNNNKDNNDNEKEDKDLKTKENHMENSKIHEYISNDYFYIIDTLISKGLYKIYSFQKGFNIFLLLNDMIKEYLLGISYKERRKNVSLCYMNIEYDFEYKKIKIYQSSINPIVSINGFEHRETKKVNMLYGFLNKNGIDNGSMSIKRERQKEMKNKTEGNITSHKKVSSYINNQYLKNHSVEVYINIYGKIEYYINKYSYDKHEKFIFEIRSYIIELISHFFNVNYYDLLKEIERRVNIV